MVSPPSPIFVADFETTTDPEDCRVWAYGYANIRQPDNVTVGKSLLEFLQTFAKMGNTVVYFHNAKFDCSFIIDLLLRMDYTPTESQKIEPKEFAVLYSDTGMFYSLRVRWSHSAVTEFRDSYKKLPMSVASIARVFNLPMKKGEIDYHARREVGWNITKNEHEYIVNDVSIVAHAVKDFIDRGMKKLTIGSDSLSEYKSLTGTKVFRRLFPVLSEEVDLTIRQAYRGGFTYATERFRNQLLERPGVVLDVNSLYPYVMYEKELPYGIPERFIGAPDDFDRLSVFSVTFKATLKPNHIPIIQIKKSFKFLETEYLSVIDEPVTLSVTNVDWKLWNEHYDIEVYYFNNGYYFNGAHDLFKDYIDKWMDVKRNSTGGEREIAKLHLNSLYGKFGTRIDVTGKYPYLDEDRVRWARGDEKTRDPVYIPMGVFITSYARELTIRAAQANYDTFAYADTDSLHLLQADAPDTLRVHPTELGAWKHEYNFSRAKYLRAKAYAEETADGMVVRISGLPVSVSSGLTFDDLYDGNVIHGKLVQRVVPGGVVLVDSPYEIKV